MKPRRESWLVWPIVALGIVALSIEHGILALIVLFVAILAGVGKNIGLPKK